MKSQNRTIAITKNEVIAYNVEDKIFYLSNPKLSPICDIYQQKSLQMLKDFIYLWESNCNFCTKTCFLYWIYSLHCASFFTVCLLTTISTWAIYLFDIYFGLRKWFRLEPNSNGFFFFSFDVKADCSAS